MKRYLIYILLSLSTLFSACSFSEVGDDNKAKKSDKDQVTVRFGVRYSVGQSQQMWTKAFADNPDISTLRLAIFNKTGYLESYITATPVDHHATQNKIENHVVYEANLPIIEDSVTIHFIANGPATLDFGSATSVIGSLYTSGRQDAYWQMVGLKDGIQKDELTGKIDAATAAKLDDVPLVRNFAKVTVTSSNDSGLELLGAYVMNNPDRGSIAPYNRAQGKFMDDYRNYTNTADLIAATSYNAFVPSSAVLNTHVPDDSEFNDVDANHAAYDFIYERESPLANPVYLIVKGYYNDEDTPCYYKVELRTPQEEYFPVLRNFDYKINIKKVLRRGAATPQEAANMSGSGDISTSIENEELINISDGESRIFVTYTDTTVVSTAPIKLKYKFIPDMETGVTANHTTDTGSDSYSIVTLGDADPEMGPAITNWVIDGDGAIGAQYEDTEGYRTITITPAPGGSTSNKQSITIAGMARKVDSDNNVTYTKIQRKVNIYVREILTLFVDCDPNEVNSAIGTPLDVILSIPAGLPRMMFPLQFNIEAEKLSITPDNDNLPVFSGKSIIPGNNKVSFMFVRELGWDEYSNMYVSETVVDTTTYRGYPCHFKTNVAASASKVYAANQYFNTNYGSFTNYTADTFSALNYSNAGPLHLGDEVTFTFNMSSTLAAGEKVQVTLDGFEPADDEERLTYVGAAPSGLPIYEMEQQGTTGNEIKLICTDYQGEGLVILDAYHYLTNSKAIALAGNKFTGLSLSKFVGSGIGATTNFTFTVSNGIPNDGLVLYLDGLVPQQSETRLSPLGNGKYSFIPSGNGTYTLALQASIPKGETSVKVTGYSYEDNSVSQKIGVKTFSIASGKLKFTSATNNSGPFGSRYNNQSTGNGGTKVYVRTVSHQDPADFTSNPSTNVTKNTQQGYGYTAYSYYNSAAINNIEVDADAQYIYFLYQFDNNVYIGKLDVSSIADGATYNPNNATEVAFATRKNENHLWFKDQELGANSQKTLVEGFDFQNEGGTLTFTSSDENIAKVQNGVLYTYGAGVAAITVKAAEGNNCESAQTTFLVTVKLRGVHISVTDNVNGNNKTNFVITNLGATKVYMRAAIAANWYDANGKIVAPWSESDGTWTGLPGTGWQKGLDGLYYQTSPVNGDGAVAPTLFTKYVKPSTPPVAGAHLEMTISVQAVEYDENVTCQEAFQ